MFSGVLGMVSPQYLRYLELKGDYILESRLSQVLYFKKYKIIVVYA